MTTAEQTNTPFKRRKRKEANDKASMRHRIRKAAREEEQDEDLNSKTM